jgi:hypothetical protein
VKQSKGKKGKQPINYPNRPKTRATNKFRLNSKSLFKPSLKEDNLIILDEDDKEKIPKMTRKENKQQPMLNVESSHSEGEMEQDPTYTLEMHELPELYTQEIQILSKSAENEVIKRSPSKEHKYGMRPRKPKISLDLNKIAPEEDYGE